MVESMLRCLLLKYFLQNLNEMAVGFPISNTSYKFGFPIKVKPPGLEPPLAP